MLKRQVRIKNSPTDSYKLLPISSDAVGLFDHSNTPRQFATVEVSSLPALAKLNGLEVERLREGAEAELNPRQFDELFIRVTNLLLRQEKEKTPTTSSFLAEKWTEISSQFSRQEWGEIFSTILKRQDQEDNNFRKIDELRGHIENENLMASERFVALIIEKGKDLIAGLSEAPPILCEYYDNLIKYNQEGDMERALTSAESFAKFFRKIPPGINAGINGKRYAKWSPYPIISETYSKLVQHDERQTHWSSDEVDLEGDKLGQELIDLLKSLHGIDLENPWNLPENTRAFGADLEKEAQLLSKTHINNWQIYSEAEQKLRSAKDDPEAEVLAMKFIEIKDKISKKQEGLQADILKLLQKLDQDLATELVPVEARPYAQIETDPNLNPFSANEGKQLTLLLQSLHNPALRNLIEADLGISFTEIPLRS